MVEGMMPAFPGVAVHRQRERIESGLRAAALGVLTLLLLGTVFTFTTSSPGALLQGASNQRNRVSKSGDDSDVDGLEKAILNEMTRGPDSDKDYSNDGHRRQPHRVAKETVVPSAMAALLHKALVEQENEEAKQEQALKAGQEDLEEQESVAKQRATKQVHEDPNLELARYVENEEKTLLQKKASRQAAAKASLKTTAAQSTSKQAHVAHAVGKLQDIDTISALNHKELVLKRKYASELSHELEEWKTSNSTINQEAERKLETTGVAERSKMDRLRAEEALAIGAIERLKQKQAQREEEAKKQIEEGKKAAADKIAIQKEIAEVQASMVKRLHALKAKLNHLDAQSPAAAAVPHPVSAPPATRATAAHAASRPSVPKAAAAPHAESADDRETAHYRAVRSEVEQAAAAAVDTAGDEGARAQLGVRRAHSSGDGDADEEEGRRAAAAAKEEEGGSERKSREGGSHLSKILKLSRDVGTGGKETELQKLRQIRHEIISDYKDVTKKGQELEHFARAHRLRSAPVELQQSINPQPW